MEEKVEPSRGEPGRAIDPACTMNATKAFYKSAYEKRMNEYFAPLHFLNGNVRITPICDTMQVGNYNNYRMAGFSAAHKVETREKLFPKQLSLAYEIGADMKPGP